MQIPKYSSGGNNYYQARITGDASGQDIVHVRTTTLDALVAGAKDISFVKCDVKGHEFECLSGANEVLSTLEPSWLVEISGNPDTRGSTASRVFELFLMHGYSPWWLNGVRLVRRKTGDRSTNYFFLKDRYVLQVSDVQFM